jgi:hypothetical protein
MGKHIIYTITNSYGTRIGFTTKDYQKKYNQMDASNTGLKNTYRLIAKTRFPQRIKNKFRERNLSKLYPNKLDFYQMDQKVVRKSLRRIIREFRN